MGCEISEEKVLIRGDEEVGCADVAVVNIEMLVDCEGAEDHLVDEPKFLLLAKGGVGLKTLL